MYNMVTSLSGLILILQTIINFWFVRMSSASTMGTYMRISNDMDLVDGITDVIMSSDQIRCAMSCHSKVACTAASFQKTSRTCKLSGKENSQPATMYFAPGFILMEKENLGYPTAVLPTCLSGWTLINETCLILVNSKQNWDNAHKNCTNRDSRLVKIDSLEKNDFVFQLVKTNDPGIGSIWLGLRQFHKRNYKWLDGTTANFTRWADGEPNRGDPAAIMWLTSGREGLWNDININFECPFVCEQALK